jgi:hypothetical protein
MPGQSLFCRQVRSTGLLDHTAFLVLFATTTGARSIATRFGSGLDTCGPRLWHLLFEGLPTP